MDILVRRVSPHYGRIKACGFARTAGIACNKTLARVSSRRNLDNLRKVHCQVWRSCEVSGVQVEKTLMGDHNPFFLLTGATAMTFGRLLSVSTAAVMIAASCQLTDAQTPVVQPVPEYHLSDSVAPPSIQPVTEATDQKAASSSEKDAEEQKKKEAEAKKKLKEKFTGTYKPLYFDNDFSYLCDPLNDNFVIGDRLKNISNAGLVKIDMGGEYRYRYHNESNHRGLGLTGVDDEFNLHRTRIFANAKVGQNFRLYGEFIDAESNGENFAPRLIEVNRADMLNLFVDATLMEGSGSDLTLRVGRQELLYGDQRVVSPLDWANTRRTFEGAKLAWKSDDTSIDTFWTNPVRISPNSFDSPDRDQEFMGTYASRKMAPGTTGDFYMLRYLNGRGANDFEYNTAGTRWNGTFGELLWLTEGAYQFGRNTDGSDHAAGATTVGLGRTMSQAQSKPTLWLYYDWASGDNDLGAGNGYHDNFPLGHKYLGFMDLFGRRNIKDINLMFTSSPSQKLKLLAWYHYFSLANSGDSPYNIVGTPFNGGNAPGSSDLGHEIDLMATWNINARNNVVFGYSHFFSGNYYGTTAGTPFQGDASFYYLQYSVNF